MKNKISPVCLQQQNSYNILGDLKVSISIDSNPYNISPDSLFAMAARQNLKRGFLFVSKVLGKHIPVRPYTALLMGAALGALYMEKVYNTDVIYSDCIIEALAAGENQEEAFLSVMQNPIELPEPTIFIGFAETATALGHSMFQCFEKHGVYVHTTRETIREKKSLVDFQEEHSHATSHRLYALNERLLDTDAPVVLIDDEITTGKTALNLIEAVHRVHPRTMYTVVSLLDWRSKKHKERFAEKEKELGVRIHTVSLLSGIIKVKGEPVAAANNLTTEACMTQDIPESRITIHKLQKLGNYFQPLLFSSAHKGHDDNRSPYIKETGRFGTTLTDRVSLEKNIVEITRVLNAYRKGKRTLCLGTEEFMYIPMRIAAAMGEGVLYHSTTRSPIHPHTSSEYGVRNAFAFPCPYDPNVTNFLYNIPHDHYDDMFIFFEREMEQEQLAPLMEVLKDLGIFQIHVVYCMGNDDNMAKPDPMGSYSQEDVKFLLKNLGEVMEEKGTEDREEAIQGGVHYSEMLPIEYKPSREYMDLFYSSLGESSTKMATAVGVVSERILQQRGPDLVLVSLARAGTPIGILIKQYMMYRHQLNLPHYSISIIRGKGIDENAVRYILKNHPDRSIQFIDGWTGKGAIAKELSEACRQFEEKYGIHLDDDLAVLADPAHCVKTYGTREDFLIASSCLNSTVSGLVSRTMHRIDLVGEHDFHGAKYYSELAEEDVSNLFINTVSTQFPNITDKIDCQTMEIEKNFTPPTWKGWRDIEEIQKIFKIDDINLIKPGIGETTRVLLRRVPWKILIKEKNGQNLHHILLLAKDKNVPVEIYPDMTYQCIGLIKPLGSE